MPLFKYKVSSPDGRSSEILIEGDSQSDSLARLRSRNLIPLEFKGEADSARAAGSFSLFKKDIDVYAFTNSLVPLLKAHIQLEKALGIIAEGQEKESTANIIAELRRGLHEGKKFSALIRDQGNRFPPIYSNLVEAGEETGSMVEVMSELQRFLNERKEMRDFLITSSIYPAVILSVSSTVVLLLFTVFLPRFSKIFLEMGRELPLPTKIMLSFSSFIHTFWWIIPILIIAAIVFFSRVKKGGSEKDIWDKITIKLPIFGKLIQSMEISRFIRTLAVLINNHVHLLTAVRIASRIIGNRTISESLAAITHELKGGSRLSMTLEKSSFIPKIVVQMLRVGEESGAMGDMLNQSAETLEGQLRTKIKRLLALFEPALILILSLVVLAVVLSIFLAIVEMNEI